MRSNLDILTAPSPDTRSARQTPAPVVDTDTDTVWIPGGEFLMGSNAHYPEEGPAHRVCVDGFAMDRLPVTNARFLRFVEDTSYVTFAERTPLRSNRSGLLDDMMYAGSLVFVPPLMPMELRLPMWWQFLRGASWRHPFGPESSIEGRDDHPVVHVTSVDAIAFARWEGKTLPTEAEWEFAARGGLSGAEYAWGDELTPDGRAMANTWQGEFPWENHLEDGFERTSPVTAFPPNGYGLYDMIGNVWEWTADWYHARHTADARGSGRVLRNPSVVRPPHGRDPNELIAHPPRKVMKGGSHLCAANYCRRYRPAARRAEGADTSACHIGFRCIVRSTSSRLPR
jgi:formylglycine-generating enzyme required for sulfatase activity